MMTDYERIFDSNSQHWSPDVEFNLLFLRAQQNHWNDILKGRGHVFLNEVFESLGFSHTPAGAVVGWTLSGFGDGYIDFMPEEPEVEGGLRLDFNVDGVILDKLGKRKVR